MNLTAKTIAMTALWLACTAGCSGSSASTGKADSPAETAETSAVDFSADSAMAYVRAQVDMGPRVPGTAAHDRCADWLVGTLGRLGADTVRIVGSPATLSDGKTVDVKNVFAQFNSEAARRIILLAHYDTRPWADHDPNPANRHTPIDGANDGASGVAVLLEIARQISRSPAEVGIDILLTDAEDYGSHADGDDAEDSWCVGAQQFADALPYAPGELPYMGILLDMVGGRDASFPMEYFSAAYARVPTAKVWAAAEKAGTSRRFPRRVGGAITDDHLPLIRAGIPVTDIIESANPATRSFNPTWHTLDDNIDNIDPSTMKAVGLTVLATIHNEKNS